MKTKLGINNNMPSLGSLIVDLALESKNFINGMRAAQAQTNATSSAISSAMNMAKGAVAGFAGVMSVDFLKDQTLAAFDYADAIVDLSDRTGASTKFLQEFRYAAQMSGSSVESADAAVDKFAKNLGAAQNGNKAMAATFHELGVTATDTDTALRQSMDGISKLGTITQRNQKSVELFGKSAADMTVMLSGGSSGFDQLASAAQSYGIVLDDYVLRNAGQVNDKLDTMKMILDAQMAGAIIQNADALVALANGFMSAATAAAHFFQQMDVKKLMSVANGINLSSDIPTVVMGRVKGKSYGQIEDDARTDLKKTSLGRQTLLTDIANRYNSELRNGANPKSAHMMAMRAEGQQIRDTDARARQGPKIDRTNSPHLPVTATKPKPSPKPSGPSAADLAKKEEQRLEAYHRDLYRATDDEISARAALSTFVTDRAGFERQLLENATKHENDALDADVKIGKLKQDEADALKALVKQTSESKLQLINNEEKDRLIQERLSVRNAGIDNETDDLRGQQALAKSMRERRDISLRLVDLEYQKEKLALEAIGDSTMASEAEKNIAKARLGILDKLKGQATADAKRSTMGPLESYLDGIPSTLDEVNESLQHVQIDGIESLSDGFKGLLTGAKSFGDVFSGVLDTVLDGILQIVLQQALIKPLGGLLGGGDSGGGGLFGGLFKSIIGGVASAVTGGMMPAGVTGFAGELAAPMGSAMGSISIPNLAGARANGGMSQPGDYLVGERGKEIVRIGAPANVMSNSAVQRLASNDNSSGGVAIHIASITSNDPAMVKAMVYEGVAQAMPMIKEQASNATIKKLQRRTI